MSKNTKTIFISNIPTDVSPLSVRDFFSEIGPIQRWFLTRDEGTLDLKGSATITYSCEADATKAVNTLDKTAFEGSTLAVKFVSKKRKPNENEFAPNAKHFKPQSSATNERSRFSSKKGRLVIRNLSYKANENNLKEHFLTCGSIKEVCILKYPDGRMKGVGFLEYLNIQSAWDAIEKLNMKPFLGRPIAVDFAIPKQEYEEYKGKPIKEEPPGSSQMEQKMNVSAIKIVKDLDDYNDHFDGDIDNKNKNTEKIEDEDKDFESDNECEDIIEEDNSDSEMDDDEMEMDDSDSENDDEESSKKSSFAHNPVSKDVLEGKTIFIRNLGFNTTEDKVEEVLSEFGDLKYVMFCKDKSTQRFTGSCFAQFMFKEGCDACLEAYEDPAQKSLFKLDGRTVTISKALGRNEVTKSSNDTKEKEKKDTRNLYLAREGVIREGTKAAFGASKADLVLRTQREIVKRKMLMNFNIYVSSTRLCVHNLPLTLNDKEMLSIFKKNSPTGSTITECRIMKNLYELDDEGEPISKGFGFVSFTKHDHAVAALRNINNNPTIFTHKARPVVEFSLENKAALKAKENRQRKSLVNIKQSKDSSILLAPSANVKSGEATSFMGATYDPLKKGMTSLATHVGPKIRHRDRDATKKISRNKINNQVRNRRKGKKKGTTKRKTTPGKKAKKLKKIRA